MFIVVSFALKAATYTEDFETLSKTAYSSATVTLTGSVEWNFTGSNAGNGTSDWKIGLVSARLAGTTKETSNAEVSKIEMLANKSGGIGSITFQYRQYGTDAQIPWFVQWSSDGTVWTQIAEITGTTDVQTFSYNLNQANARIRIIANGFATSSANGKRINIDNLILTDNGGTPVSATPTFTPASGTIYAPINVTITAGTGASIYYTTNGNEPTNASTPYTVPINVSATTTVKAIAYETGKNPSTVATATYTWATATEIPNIAGLRAITLPSTDVYKLTGEAVLTLQSSTRNAKYIQDATGAVLVDDPSKKITSTYNLGDGITGITGTLALYQNMLQFTPVTDPGAATSTGKTVTPLALSLSDLSSHQAELVKISGVTISDVDGGTGSFVVSKSYNLNGGTNPVLRTQYGDLNYIGQAIPAPAQDIVGVVLIYGSTAQFVPRSFAEMVSTGVSKTSLQQLNLWTAAGKINFNAAAGEMVEVYNTLGQRLYNAAATEGQNQVQVSLKGVAIVKVGNRVGKVIL